MNMCKDKLKFRTDGPMWRAIWALSLVVSLGTIFQGCESLGEDDLPNISEFDPVEFTAAKQAPVVLNLLDGVKSSTPLLLRLETGPALGSLDLPGKSLGIYEVDADAIVGRDNFTVVMEIDGEEIKRDFVANITDRPTYPISEGIAIYDRGGIVSPDSTVIADILANDAFDNESGSIVKSLQIEVSPSSGEAIITEDYKLQYTPDPVLSEGLVDIVYSVELETGEKGYALVRFLVTSEGLGDDSGERDQDSEDDPSGDTETPGRN